MSTQLTQYQTEAENTAPLNILDRRLDSPALLSSHSFDHSIAFKERSMDCLKCGISGKKAVLTIVHCSRPDNYTIAMESSHSMHLAQPMRQSSSFYYSPDPIADYRQLGHFTPHPNAVHDGLAMHHYQQQLYQNEMVMHGQYSMYAPLPSSGPPTYHPQKSMLAMASLRPMQQKPAFLCQYEGQQLSVDTECSTPDLYIYPSTPPLSFSSSASSSPPSTCDILPTPVTSAYMGLEKNIEGVKEGCQSDVQSEILAGGDWTRCCSPPLTPGTSHRSLNCCLSLNTFTIMD